MKSGEKLLEIELGKEKSKKYKKLYSAIVDRITEKMDSPKSELELIKKFMNAKNEFDKYKPKNKNNELFHTSLRKFAFNNYNLFFLMRDSLENHKININLFTEKGVYYIKTNNYLIINNKIIEIENYKRNDNFYVLSENLIHVNTYRRLSNIYKLINVKKADEYENIMNNIINEYHEINEILKMNYSKLDLEIIDSIAKGRDNYELSYLRGDIFMREKKYRLAEGEYKTVLPFDKLYKNLYLKIGNCLTEQMKYKESLKYYNEIQDKDYEILFNIGYAYYKLNNIDKAIEYFTESLLINEKCLETYLNLSMCHIKQFNLDMAMGVVNQGLKKIGRNEQFDKIINKIKIKKMKSSNLNIIINEDSTYRTMKEVKA